MLNNINDLNPKDIGLVVPLNAGVHTYKPKKGSDDDEVEVILNPNSRHRLSKASEMFKLLSQSNPNVMIGVSGSELISWQQPYLISRVDLEELRRQELIMNGCDERRIFVICDSLSEWGSKPHALDTLTEINLVRQCFLRHPTSDVDWSKKVCFVTEEFHARRVFELARILFSRAGRTIPDPEVVYIPNYFMTDVEVRFANLREELFLEFTEQWLNRYFGEQGEIPNINLAIYSEQMEELRREWSKIMQAAMGGGMERFYFPSKEHK